jgi:isopentenyl-diphosphate Delta-isomerase
MEAHVKGILHRAFSILVFNSNKELLLQKRERNKYHSPSLWTNTCCSHPRYGETLDEAVKRRLKEEMGFTCELKEVFSFIYKVEFENKLYEHEYDHVFLGYYEGEIVPNKHEVEDYKWITFDDLNIDLQTNPHNYTHWFILLFNQIKDNLNQYISKIIVDGEKHADK